jgi:hypothetical protein
MTPNNALYSTMVRAGRTTYFVDLKETKSGNKYLLICETKIDGDEKKKTTIRVFADSINEFRRAIDDAAASVTE